MTKAITKETILNNWKEKLSNSVESEMLIIEILADVDEFIVFIGLDTLTSGCFDNFVDGTMDTAFFYDLYHICFEDTAV